jgi:hypothetical protein
LGSLERVGAQVEQLGQAQLNQRLGPDIEALRPLLHEHRLPLVVTQAGEVARRRSSRRTRGDVRALACQQLTLVVAVEVHPERVAAAS